MLNKNWVHLLYLLINWISVKSAPHILSLKVYMSMLYSLDSLDSFVQFIS